MPEIRIEVDYAELRQRAARLAKALALQPVDRPPLWPIFLCRYWLHLFGISYQDYFSNPELMLSTQLRWKKWLFENIYTDETSLHVIVDLQHHGAAWALGCELAFDADHPWIKSHPLKGPEDLEGLRRRDILDNEAIRYESQMRGRMQALAEDYPLRFADGEVIYPAREMKPYLGSTAVFTLAADLRGPQIYLDIKENPGFVKDLMEIVLEKSVQLALALRQQGGLSRGTTYLCDDSAGVLSPRDYREFVLPYNFRFLQALGRPCWLHCDAKADHLLEIFAEEIRPDCFFAFGHQTNRRLVAQHFGGKAAISGNINPVIIHRGTPEQVFRETLECLEIFAPHAGYIVQDGANIAPGSPMENINAMYRAALHFMALR